VRARLEFAYDHQSRRIAKTVKNAESGALQSRTLSLYDRWNLVAELEMKQQSQITNLKSTYVWGVDLSETETGAGGVGGLLLYRKTESGTPTTFAACSDANGNLTSFLSLDTATLGNEIGRNHYDPFGRRITSTLPTSFCPIGFSSKYSDSETSLVYYGYRYLNTETGRWLNRDPIGEKGGINLYGMVGNDAVNRWDLLGRWEGSGGGPDGPPIFTDNPGGNKRPGPGVSWRPPGCKGFLTKYVQRVVNGQLGPFSLQPFIDDYNDNDSPYYGDGDELIGEDFQDTPKGWNGTPTFELCQVCVCKKGNRIHLIGPCITWSEADMYKGPGNSTTDLGSLPTIRAGPSAELKAQIEREYPAYMANDQCCSAK
jgi:RHS repeat-associated protein